MRADNEKTIGNWLGEIESGHLCLPRFQRKPEKKPIWNGKKVCEFLKTLVLNTETPVGVFLTLSNDPTKSKFHPRMMDSSISQSKTCGFLLLDGQQRLLALWKTICDKDEKYRYYIKFDSEFNIKDIAMARKGTDAEKKRKQNPKLPYKKNWFPAVLLNPLSDTREMYTWLEKLELDSTDSIKELIINTRKIFSKHKKNGKIIPHFLLPGDMDRDTAINVYQTINTNLVKLSFHYLAVAKMEKETKPPQSLYDMADRLVKKVPLIENLETDEIGELILKISCVLQGKKVSGGSYDSLNLPQIVNEESKIFEGVQWAVEKLGELSIWYGEQLPSVMPLRVLPALHRYLPASGQERANANQIVTKYLWYTFLTDRYNEKANERLGEDYKDLRKYFKGGRKEEIKIFKEHELPHRDEIKNAGLPKTTNRFPRGILLFCCQRGAKTLGSNEPLTINSYRKRNKHHIFPRSKLNSIDKKLGDRVLNCLFVPRTDNAAYGNNLPGDCIKVISESLGMPPSQAEAEVAKRLETHLISEELTRDLMKVTQDEIYNNKITLEDSYNKFLEERASYIKKKIKEMLAW